MSFLKQTLTLSTAGASLIASNSFWFFDFFGIHPIQDNSISEQEAQPTSNTLPPILPPPKKSTDNINVFRSANKHENINGSSLKNASLRVENNNYFGFGADITLEDLEENKNKKYISQITSLTLGDFTLSLFPTTEEEYKNFPKNQIKIRLFKNPAWYSSTEEDEYSPELNESEIEDLFKGQDEAKVKQLLLSLNKGLKWKKFGYDENEKRTKFLSELFYSSRLEDLSDLKIKYFKNFAGLKDYIHTKISTCKGEKIACIANKDELNIMDTDQPSFFENLKNLQST